MQLEGYAEKPTATIWTKRLECFVPGLPETKGSMKAFKKPGARFASITASNAGKLGQWQGRVAEIAGAHFAGPIIDGPVKMEMIFYFLRPESHFRTSKSGTGRDLRNGAPVLMSNGKDLDKLERAIFDALSKLVYVDDRQVCGVVKWKHYAAPERPGGVRIVVLVPVEDRTKLRGIPG